MKTHDGRTSNIYSRRTFRLNRIFLIQPGKLSGELRKQHFFIRRIPRLSILHKQQSFSAGSLVAFGEVWRKISRPRYNLFRVAPLGVEGKTKRRLKAGAFVKYIARKRENGEDGKGGGRKGGWGGGEGAREKQKRLRWPQKSAWARSSNISDGTLCVAVFCISSSLPTNSIPDISRRGARRAVWAERITFNLRFRR